MSSLNLGFRIGNSPDSFGRTIRCLGRSSRVGRAVSFLSDSRRAVGVRCVRKAGIEFGSGGVTVC